MKILYIVRQARDVTLNSMIEQQQKQHDIEVVELKAVDDYSLLLDKIEKCDKVISW